MEGRKKQAVQREVRAGGKPREEVEESVPDGVDPAQWRQYIGWRMTDLGHAREQQGQNALAQQQVAHKTWSKPMIVGYDEMLFNIYYSFCLIINCIILIIV